MAKALEVFYRPVVNERRREVARLKFYREQLDILTEIAACFDPRVAQRLFEEAQQQLVMPWTWSDYQGGALLDGTGRLLARVWRPVDGVVCWEANKHVSSNQRHAVNGHRILDELGPDFRDVVKPVLIECREAAEAWLREKGVLT